MKTMTDEPGMEDVGIPTLRTKRPHKKVRSGCASCKRARVKCDERRPRCTRCYRKEKECGYTNRPNTRLFPADLPAEDSHRNSEYASSESPRNSADKSSPCTTNLQTLGGIRDTELAKHYLTHTLQTFAEGGMCEHQSDVWRILIPAVALTCPVVRQGMLTLAAICLHYESSPDHLDEHYLEYLEVAEAHGKIFVKESRQKLQDFQQGLNTQDQDSILACSRLLSVLGFAFFRTHRQNGTTLADPAAWTWLHLLRGARTSHITVVEAGRPIDAIFLKDMIPHTCYHKQTPRMGMGMGCLDSYFRLVQQSQRGFIDAVRVTLNRDWSYLGDQKTDDLSVAIDLLYQVTEQVCSQQPQSLFRTICTWPVDVPRGFVDMLMAGSPPALVLYAHWLVLMVPVEDLWWVDDMGRDGIIDVIALCSDADPHIHSLLTWPQRMLDVWRESADAVP